MCIDEIRAFCKNAKATECNEITSSLLQYMEENRMRSAGSFDRDGVVGSDAGIPIGKGRIVILQGTSEL